MKKSVLIFCISICLFSVAHAGQTLTQDTTLQEYVGKYKFPDGSVVAEVVVTLENDALSMASSAGVSPLEKQTAADVFTITQFQGTAKFNRDSNKKIIGVSINAMGYELEGVKEGATGIMYKMKFLQPAAKSLVVALVH